MCQSGVEQKAAARFRRLLQHNGPRVPTQTVEAQKAKESAFSEKFSTELIQGVPVHSFKLSAGSGGFLEELGESEWPFLSL